MRDKWEKIVTYVTLMRYGMNVGQCLWAMCLFIVVGIAFEIMDVLGVTAYRNMTGIDFGAMILYGAAMYPAQILMSLDISGMVQASPYKKRIQTSAMSLASLFGNLAALTIVLLVRGLGAWTRPERAALIWYDLPVVGLIGLVLSIMSVFLYKFYLPSIIAMAVIFGGAGSWAAVAANMGLNTGVSFLSGMPLPAVIVFCAAMILLGNGTQYLIAGMIYKRPYSKAAFGNATEKKFV